MAGLKGYLAARRDSSPAGRRRHARHAGRRQAHAPNEPQHNVTDVTEVADPAPASEAPTRRRWGEWQQPQAVTDDGQLIVYL